MRIKVKFLAAIVLLLIPATCLGPRIATEQEQVINVATGTAERICTGSVGTDGQSTTSCKYMVYADEGVFENTDDWMSLKFRSSDFHRDYLKGGCFKVTTIGWRVGWLSMYPNIIKSERCQNG